MARIPALQEIAALFRSGSNAAREPADWKAVTPHTSHPRAVFFGALWRG